MCKRAPPHWTAVIGLISASKLSPYSLENLSCIESMRNHSCYICTSSNQDNRRASEAGFGLVPQALILSGKVVRSEPLSHHRVQSRTGRGDAGGGSVWTGI